MIYFFFLVTLINIHLKMCISLYLFICNFVWLVICRPNIHIIGKGRECHNGGAIRVAGWCEWAHWRVWWHWGEDRTAGKCYKKGWWSTAENGPEGAGVADHTSGCGVLDCGRWVAVWDPLVGGKSWPSAYGCMNFFCCSFFFFWDRTVVSLWEMLIGYVWFAL
jgi:hypothetical protein